MIASSTQHVDSQKPLSIRVRRYAKKHDLKTLLVQIPWNLNNGPNDILPDPRGEPFMDKGMLKRSDEYYPFAYMCYLYRGEKSPSEMVKFLHIFDARPQLYERFYAVFEYLCSIDMNISSVLARTFLHFISLNGLFEHKDPFGYLFAYFKNGGSPITRKNLKNLQCQYNKQYSLSKKYQSLFGDCLTKKEKEYLLQELRITERTSEGTKPIDLESIEGLAKELYNVFRCGGAHGKHLLQWTFVPEETVSGGIVTSYRDDSKRKALWSGLAVLEWECLVRKMILRFFEKQGKLRKGVKD